MNRYKLIILCFSLCFSIVSSYFIIGCAAPPQTPVENEPPTQATTPSESSPTPLELSYIVVDLEECAQNLGKNTGKEHRAKGSELRLTKEEYVEFMRKDLYIYRSGEYKDMADPICIKCAIRLLDYLNQMSPDNKQRMAELYMTAYQAGYDGK